MLILAITLLLVQPALVLPALYCLKHADKKNKKTSYQESSYSFCVQCEDKTPQLNCSNKPAF